MIPDEWKAALEEAPDDFNARLALVDWFLDRGLELEAEAIRWSVEKRRRPERSVSHWHWFQIGDGDSNIPGCLFLLVNRVEGERCSKWFCFDRLITAWKNMQPVDRDYCWGWTPPPDSRNAKRPQPPTGLSTLQKLLWVVQRGLCFYCRRPCKLDEEFTIDHFVPTSKRGSNRLSNKVGACSDCNGNKANNLYPVEFFEQRIQWFNGLFATDQLSPRE